MLVFYFNLKFKGLKMLDLYFKLSLEMLQQCQRKRSNGWVASANFLLQALFCPLSAFASEQCSPFKHFKENKLNITMFVGDLSGADEVMHGHSRLLACTAAGLPTLTWKESAPGALLLETGNIEANHVIRALTSSWRILRPCNPSKWGNKCYQPMNEQSRSRKSKK